jgi:membrane protease YdiL (CAAX protease family)
MISGGGVRIAFALALTAAVFLAAIYGARFLPHGGLPVSFVTDCLMLGLSLAAIAVISKGRPGLFGFTLGRYRFSPLILLWTLPSAIPSILQALALPRGEAAQSFVRFTWFQAVIFIWIYSSICEEILVRGLLQTLLNRSPGAATMDARWWTVPAVISAVFFGAMHLVLVPLLGSGAIPIVLLATFLGFVAAHYRQASGSLVPAIMVHMLFNIGGSLPLWVIPWMRR